MKRESVEEKEEKRRRLNDIYDYLRSVGEVHSQKDFAEKLGRYEGAISSALNQKNGNYLNGVLRSVAEKYKEIINPDYVLYGEGEMLVNQVTEEVAPSDANIRYWMDVDATGGGVELFGDTMTERMMVISLPGFGDCTDAVNIFGDSMSPLYKSGEIIILRPWTDNWIDYGQIYLIITTSGYRMVKYVKAGSDEAHIRCVSENKEHEDFEIPKADIVKMYLVKGSISRNTI